MRHNSGDTNHLLRNYIHFLKKIIFMTTINSRAPAYLFNRLCIILIYVNSAISPSFSCVQEAPIVVSLSIFGGYLNKIHERTPYFISDSVLYLLILSEQERLWNMCLLGNFQSFNYAIVGKLAIFLNFRDKVGAHVLAYPVSKMTRQLELACYLWRVLFY